MAEAGARRDFASVEELEAAAGGPLGTSGWIAVEQDRIDAFAEATDDRQWIHVDVARAKAESPYRSPVAHGYLTLSLLPRMMAEAFRFTARTTGINYGLDRVRFMAPVPAGGRIRGHVSLRRIERLDAHSVRASMTVTVELEGSDKPACVAEPIAIWRF